MSEQADMGSPGVPRGSSLPAAADCKQVAVKHVDGSCQHSILLAQVLCYRKLH
jgi:hypothetical protein